MPKTTDREVLLQMVEDGELETSKLTPFHIAYSHLFCELCETQYRSILVRFTDGSVFTLCTECVEDLHAVCELFALDCELTPIRLND